MSREDIFLVLQDLDNRYISESVCYDPESASGSPERIVHLKKKRIITFALAAVLMLALGVTAYAGVASVATPQAAEKVAREQIEVWKEMGLLSQDVTFEGPANAVLEIEEYEGGDYWYGRFFPHSYDVRWYCNRQYDQDWHKYGCNLRVDTLSGKIMWANIDAVADENAVPERKEDIEVLPDPEGEPTTQTWYFYDNYTDIFPADITVDRFCSLLAEYWGFSGYTLAETVDEFYNTHFEAIDGSTLLKDLNGDTRENYYLTVFFDGDQKGAPMYIQLHQFPGYVNLTLGTGHGVG